MGAEDIGTRAVSLYQRVPRVEAGPYVSGSCEFCLWEGKRHNPTQQGRIGADLESRVHLGKEHPERVTYWGERTVTTNHINVELAEQVRREIDELRKKFGA
jgi:hypothetical protein